MTGVAANQHLTLPFPLEVALSVGEIPLFQGGIYTDFIHLIFQLEELSVTQAKSPSLVVVGVAVRDPLRIFRKSEQMWPQFFERHLLMNRDAVAHDVKIGFLEIDDLFTPGVLHIGIFNIPFFGHTPIEDLGSRRNLLYLQGNIPVDQAQRLPDAVASNTPANWVQFRNKPMYFEADGIWVNRHLGLGETHCSEPCANKK